MRLEIRYESRFVYDEPVWDSHNLLRACPASDLHQTLVSYGMRSSPRSHAIAYTDYWGNRVDAFGVREPHTELAVIAESVVETTDRPNPLGTGALLQSYRDDTVVLGNYEVLQPSPHTAWNDATHELAADTVMRCTSAVEAVLALQGVVRSRLSYAPGATFVGMDVNTVVEQGKGVCQDFAHVMISLARSVGIPARYVSGYLYSEDQSVGTPPEQAEIEIQTHAWVEVLIPEWGWWPLDPTNPTVVGQGHVKIGHGRDYDDVMPLKGVFAGPADGNVGVSVRISRDRLSQFEQSQIDQ